jgi:glutamate/aspartate transport system substrate-binding protein
MSNQAAVSKAYRSPSSSGRSNPKEGTPMKLTLKIVGALLVTGVASSALAQGTLEKIKSSGTISVGHRDASIPFAYLDDKQQPVGYSMDLCAKIVDAVKTELKMPNLKVALQPVTSATRIPLLANGTIDMECGSTTNNAERQKQIAYTMTSFVTANRFISKKADNLTKLADLKGKTVVSTSGSTNIKQITELNASQNLNLNILAAKDHAEAFLMVELPLSSWTISCWLDWQPTTSTLASGRCRPKRCRSNPMASWFARMTQHSRR